MASPTLETFCCGDPNGTAPYKIELYNSICLCSSVISAFGAILQIVLQSSNPSGHTCNINLRTITRNLALADLFACIGILIRSIAWLCDYIPTTTSNASIFCIIVESWIHYFYVCTYFWTFLYAMEFRVFVHSEYTNSIPYKFIGWFIALVITAGGLIPLYLPSLKSCNQHTLLNTLPHYLSAYLPICCVFLFNPVIYYLSVQDVRHNLMRSLVRYTNYERNIVSRVQRKFRHIMLVFAVCWSPNIINGILLWFYACNLWTTIPPYLFEGLWGYMAFVNPLQAFLNLVVYRRAMLRHFGQMRAAWRLRRPGVSISAPGDICETDVMSICSVCVTPSCGGSHADAAAGVVPGELDCGSSGSLCSVCTHPAAGVSRTTRADPGASSSVNSRSIDS